MTVRRVRADEADRLRELRLRALQADPHAFGRSYEEEAADTSDRWRDLAADSERGEQRAVFVDDAFTGMAGAVLRDDHVELWGMWVDPAARGTGLGRELVAAVVDWARDRGAAAVNLGVYDNAQVAPFYERLGFVEGGTFGSCDHGFTLDLTR